MTNNPGANRARIANVLRVTSGNFLEMFDFFLFGFYATYISKTFFPSGDEYASLMLTFATFGAGFLMRPLGAIILGSYIDHIGRRKGLLLTLSIMASGTVLIAFVPGYASIGMLAPLLVLTGRLLQGFSAGVELGGVSVYLSEMATPGNKGFYVSWQSASQQVAIMVSAVLGYGLSQWLTPGQVGAQGRGQLFRGGFGHENSRYLKPCGGFPSQNPCVIAAALAKRFVLTALRVRALGSGNTTDAAVA